LPNVLEGYDEWITLLPCDENVRLGYL